MDKKLKTKYDRKRFRNIYGTEWETGANVVYIL